MSTKHERGHWLSFIGFGLILTSFLTFDALLLLWLFGAPEAWQWGSVSAGAALLVVGALMLLIGKRRKQ